MLKQAHKSSGITRVETGLLLLFACYALWSMQAAFVPGMRIVLVASPARRIRPPQRGICRLKEPRRGAEVQSSRPGQIPQTIISHMHMT